MSDEDAKAFEQRTIGFGKHVGERYGDVPTGYLVWLAEQNEELASYLRSPVGQARQDEA